MCSFVYVLSLTTSVLQWPSWALATETTRPTEPQIFTYVAFDRESLPITTLTSQLRTFHSWPPTLALWEAGPETMIWVQTAYPGGDPKKHKGGRGRSEPENGRSHAWGSDEQVIAMGNGVQSHRETVYSSFTAGPTWRARTGYLSPSYFSKA